MIGPSPTALTYFAIRLRDWGNGCTGGAFAAQTTVASTRTVRSRWGCRDGWTESLVAGSQTGEVGGFAAIKTDCHVSHPFELACGLFHVKHAVLPR